jgi:hypothetical protein
MTGVCHEPVVHPNCLYGTELLKVAIPDPVAAYRGAPGFLFNVQANLTQIIAAIPLSYNDFSKDTVEQLLSRRFLLLKYNPIAEGVRFRPSGAIGKLRGRVAAPLELRLSLMQNCASVLSNSG